MNDLTFLTSTARSLWIIEWLREKSIDETLKCMNLDCYATFFEVSKSHWKTQKLTTQRIPKKVKKHQENKILSYLFHIQKCEHITYQNSCQSLKRWFDISRYFYCFFLTLWAYLSRAVCRSSLEKGRGAAAAATTLSHHVVVFIKKGTVILLSRACTLLKKKEERPTTKKCSSFSSSWWW